MGDKSSELFDKAVSSGYHKPFGKWATRGWTLQELIAPRDVLLLSQEWEIKGSRDDLADALEKATRIPAAVLTRQVDVYSFSIAEHRYYTSQAESYGDYLFAPSVSCFRDPRIPDSIKYAIKELRKYQINPPSLHYNLIRGFGTNGHLLAILSATSTAHSKDAEDVLVALILRPRGVGADPLRPLYSTGDRIRNLRPHLSCLKDFNYPSLKFHLYRRCINISRSDWNYVHQWEFKGWQDVYIVPALQDHPAPSSRYSGPSPAYGKSTPFRIHPRDLRALEIQYVRWGTHLTKRWVFKHNDEYERWPPSEYYYTLSLSPCLVNPDTTYTIHLTATQDTPATLDEFELYNTVPSMFEYWEAAVKTLKWRGQIKPAKPSRPLVSASTASIGETVEDPTPSVELTLPPTEDSSVEEEAQAAHAFRCV
ncbi:hypothetical protein C8Q80DRAFT_1341959 [Daedaleopsis nitida]|nr:hypothetical protein C8Q80DRAFT_1341959 [Daedaleopsis nitida]